MDCNSAECFFSATVFFVVVASVCNVGTLCNRIKKGMILDAWKFSFYKFVRALNMFLHNNNNNIFFYLEQLYTIFLLWERSIKDGKKQRKIICLMLFMILFELRALQHKSKLPESRSLNAA